MHAIAEGGAPRLNQPLAANEAAQLADLYGVLADSTRLRLLSLISASSEPCAACDLVETLNVSQPTVSHHLKVLREAGLVESERRGRWIYYRSVPERLGILGRTPGTRR